MVRTAVHYLKIYSVRFPSGTVRFDSGSIRPAQLTRSSIAKRYRKTFIQKQKGNPCGDSGAVPKEVLRFQVSFIAYFRATSRASDLFPSACGGLPDSPTSNISFSSISRKDCSCTHRHVYTKTMLNQVRWAWPCLQSLAAPRAHNF